MKFKVIITLLLAFVLLCPLSVNAEEEQAAPSVSAQNAIVIHLNSGITAYEKNADQKISPGCSAKVMTAILAMEKGKLDTLVEAKPTAYKGISSLSPAKIQKGEILSAKDLVYCLMVATSNEAANILAEYVSGDISSFVKEMNKKAKEIGAKNTKFTNPQGVYDEAAYSTARDTAKIMEYASKIEGFMEIANTTVYTLPATNLNANERVIYTNNQLIISTSPSYCSLARGIKTASTSEGGGSLATIGEKKTGNSAQRVLVVTMGCMKSDSNTALGNAFSDCKALINWFYSSHKVTTLVKKNETAIEVKVELSGKKDFTLLMVEDNFSTLVPSSFTNDKLQKKYIVPKSVMAPIEKGQVIGTMVLSYEGVEYGSVNLISQTTITRNAMMYYSYQLNLFFRNIWVKIVSALIGCVFLLYLIYAVFYNRSHRHGRRVKRRIKF